LSCVICFGEYAEGDLINQLPCQVGTRAGQQTCLTRFFSDQG
jgi:hypothetical protein